VASGLVRISDDHQLGLMAGEHQTPAGLQWNAEVAPLKLVTAFAVYRILCKGIFQAEMKNGSRNVFTKNWNVLISQIVNYFFVCLTETVSK
jgi:hypothetical protein